MSQLSTMNWVDVERKLRVTDLGLVPVGAVEVYGPHMPQGTDGIVAQALCLGVADEIDCLVEVDVLLSREGASGRRLEAGAEELLLAPLHDARFLRLDEICLGGVHVSTYSNVRHQKVDFQRRVGLIRR